MLKRLVAARVSLVVGGACGKEAPTAEPVNILLLLIEFLRTDRAGCYGCGRDTSPKIGRRTREGTIFENHISTTSWTLSAHNSLFTGQESSGEYNCLLAELAPAFYAVRGSGVKLQHNAPAGATVLLNLNAELAETHSRRA